jgi:hypothetical protein
MLGVVTMCLGSPSSQALQAEKALGFVGGNKKKRREEKAGVGG